MENPAPGIKISVVMPVYNELKTIREIIARVRAVNIDKEIICIDDASTDGTARILQEEAAAGTIRALFHEKNQGKGAAVRTGLRAVTGDFVIIQDADLEYDPEDYYALIRPIVRGKTKVVYGSRFLGEHKAMYFWHAVGNRLVTLLTNILYDSTLTDMETCYKVFPAEIAHRINLKANRWGFDPEITAKIMRMGHRIYEVPVSYTGREFDEGKKLTGWRDVWPVIFTIIKYRFVKD
ncbi:MAG: glycosyltransferase family 2 protein [Chloroflexota bacterium]|nr:MAG: glycosyltransferase family 2 protein [Chloroflexota bacterium]